MVCFQVEVSDKMESRREDLEKKLEDATFALEKAAGASADMNPSCEGATFFRLSFGALRI